MNKFKSFIKENWLLIVAILYVLAPVDLIPDVIPILGKADDTTVLLLEVVKRYLELKKTNEKI